MDIYFQICTFLSVSADIHSKTPEGFELKDCCRVAGLGPEKDHRRDGSVAYYLSEPNVVNDNKAIAALFMAYAQYLLGKQMISEI